MLQKFVCATNSQFSHVYVPPSTFKVNDSNLSPKEKCSGGKTTFKTWTCANSSFFLNTGTPQSSTTGLFSCPCYLPQGQTEDFFWVCLPSLYNLIPHEKLRFPLQRGGSPGLRKPRVVYPSLCFCHPLLSRLCTLPGYHQFLSNNTWPQHEKVFEDLTYIFIIMSIYHSALYK